MEQLSELEKRVLDVIQKNKDLREKNHTLSTENSDLQEQCKRLEASLMDQSSSKKSLESETDAVKSTIKGLLDMGKKTQK